MTEIFFFCYSSLIILDSAQSLFAKLLTLDSAQSLFAKLLTLDSAQSLFAKFSIQKFVKFFLNSNLQQIVKLLDLVEKETNWE